MGRYEATVTREELIAAVLADPEVLWAVRVAEVRCAGPWIRTDAGSWRWSDQPDPYQGDEAAARCTRLLKFRARSICANGHETRGKAGFCKECGSPNTRVPPSYSWRVDKPADPTGKDVFEGTTYQTREEAEAVADFWLALAGWMAVGFNKDG